MYVGVAGRLDPTYDVPDDEMTLIDDALARGDNDAAASAISAETLRRFCVFGTPHDIISHTERLFDAGVDIFELGTPHGVNEHDAIRILGEEVLPYFDG
jgi:alkanesulfonate monooxygenase SsuD/methylene tetrahydromethanopterin reductase-like flavin-dependent oxidoreductase (luciferase family)